jgi:hypothetical protein
MNYKTIEDWCIEFDLFNYRIEENGVVNVNGDVKIKRRELEAIPIQFGIVAADFNCGRNNLLSLHGSPYVVIGNYYCNNNKLTSLKGASDKVGRSFYCDYNDIESLEGSPGSIFNSFYCFDNKLTSLKGGPKIVQENYNCNNNLINSLEGYPDRIHGYFICQYNKLISPSEIFNNIKNIDRFKFENNAVYNLYKLFMDYDSFKESLDHGYLRNGGIIKGRLKTALKEINIIKELPESIEGYEYIDL